MSSNPPLPSACVCLCTCMAHTCLFVCCESAGWVGGVTSNDRLWKGLSVCVVSDSMQGVSSASECQGQIEWVKIWLENACNERPAICEGMSMILSCNPPSQKTMSPIFSPFRTPQTQGLHSQIGWQRFSPPSNSTPPHHLPTHPPCKLCPVPDRAASTWLGNCAGGCR